TQARARLSNEAISNLNGQVRVEATATATPNGAAASTLPPGDYLLVTIVLSATALPELSGALSVEGIQTVLEGIGGLTENSLFAFEVIWQPTNPDQSLSRDDLLTLYPEIAPV